MSDYASLGKLIDFLPDIPGATTFLDAVEKLDLRVLEQVNILDVVISENSFGEPIIHMAVAISGETIFPLPLPDFITFQLGATIPGFTFLRIHLSLGENGYLHIYDFRLALRIAQSFLRLYDIDTGQFLSDEFRIELDAAIIIDKALDLQFELYNFNIPPFTIANTGLVMGLERCQILEGVQAGSPDGTIPFGDREFMGIRAKSAILYWLPQIQMPFAPFKGVQLEFEDVLLEKTGISCDFGLSWHVSHENGQFLPDTEFSGVLFGDQIRVALAQANGRIIENIPRLLTLNGLIEIPFLQTVFAVTFSLDADPERETYATTISVSKTSDQSIIIPLGSSTYGLSIHTLLINGELSDEGFHIQGLSGFALDLPGLSVNVAETRASFTHSKDEDRFSFTIEDLELGPLGTVDEATLQLIATCTADGIKKLGDISVEIELTWQDLRQRLNLQLPEQFPLPPDNATVTAYLNWVDDGAGGYKLVLRFAAELSDLGTIWSFIPEAFRPEVRNIRFAFEATYANATEFQNASNTSSFSGTASVEMELRPPALPTVPGADLFEYDQEQWIKASLKGGMRSVNGANEGYMELGIHGAPELGVNLPGLPQNQPPIQIELKKVDFNLKAQQGTDQLTGQLKLDGGFKFGMIDLADSKLPVPPAMATHMEKLFKPETVFQLTAQSLEALKSEGLPDDILTKLEAIKETSYTEGDFVETLKTTIGTSETEKYELLIFKHSDTNRGFGGTAKFDLKFKGEKVAASLDLGFDQARLQMDMFDMIASAARGMTSAPEMDGSANGIDLDIDVDIKLSKIGIKFGSIEDTAATDPTQFGFELGLAATIASVQVDDFSFKLSNKEFSFGFGELAIPIALPRFPVKRDDLDALRDATDMWNYEDNWQKGERLHLRNSIIELKDEIDALKQSADTQPYYDDLLRKKRKLLFELSARQFLIDSIFGVHQLVGDSNRVFYQGMVEAYLALMDATVHQIAFDTELNFVLSNVRFVLPLKKPSDIRVEGGAKLSGFKDDDPMKPLGDLEFRLGLSAEYIYFSVEGGDPIPLPGFGEYENADGEMEAKVSVQLNHARIGYGYSKNALVVALAGQLRLAESLVDDLNTADDIGIGIRLPEQSRLGFKLDLIPISLGEVNFLLPLLEFDVDLRKEYSPGIVDSSTCEPYWDGAQLVAPNIIRSGFKHFRFSPFFGSLLAPNYKLGYDLMLGNAQNGFTYVCDDYLVITPTSPYTIIPLLADGVPFFNNLCTNIRLAGFGVNFNLQRPFPSMSPMALFEIFGLLADPMMPIDPDGALANTIRATILNARITLPPAVVRMFPEHGPTLTREINYTINLGTLITVVQAVAGPVGQIVQQLQNTTGDVTDYLQSVKDNPPQVSPAEVLALLPPELRRVDLEGSFVGFEASASFVLLTPAEAKAAFVRRDNPPPDNSLLRPPRFGELADPAWLTTFQPKYLKPAIPIYDPTDPEKSPLKAGVFEAFTDKDLPTPDVDTGGVLVGAEVKLLEHQVFRFLGYVFTDGNFGLHSSLNLEPLRLSVAGISAELPLQVNGRLMLRGRAKGAQSYAEVTAAVWGAWQPIPNLIELHAGSKDKPIELVLHSNGRFALKGAGQLKLFGNAATINGSVDISQTHCFVEGSFTHNPNYTIGGNRIVRMELTSTGRIGPGRSFEISGTGDLWILGRRFSNVRGLVSDKGIAIEGQLHATSSWHWGQIQIREFRMALRGMIDLSQSGPPNFLFEGDAYLRLFGNPTSANRLEITGRGGMKAEAGDLMTYLEGKLFWQGREWVQGRLELGTNRISVSGRTAFALNLTPSDLPSNIKLASLYFRVELSGSFTLSAGGGLERCNLEIDWLLAVQMPGIDQQLPIAMQKKQFEYAGGVNPPQQIELLNLITINSALFVPFGELQLPIPTVTVDEFTQYYWYWQDITPSTKPKYKRVRIVNSTNVNDSWRFPTSVGEASGKTDITNAISKAFNIPYPPPLLPPPPPPRIEVPKFSGADWKRIEINDEELTLPTIRAPRISANPPANSTSNELFKLPTKFKVSFPNNKVSLLENLNFSLHLTWKDRKLGLTVKQGSTERFIAFDKMFSS